MGKVKWLKDCQICNEGLIAAMDQTMENGFNLKQAARKLADQAKKASKGIEIISATAIRERYRYHKEGRTNWQKTPSKSEFESDMKSFLSHLRTAVNSARRINRRGIKDEEVAAGKELLERVSVDDALNEIMAFKVLWRAKLKEAKKKPIPIKGVRHAANQ